MTAAVVIASAGRPEVLTFVLQHIGSAVAGVGEIVVCVPDESSRPTSAAPLERVQVVVGPRGAAAQRNFAVARLQSDPDVVFFFDDDCLPAADYVTAAMRRFDRDASVAGITGLVVYDGAKQGDVSTGDGLRRLAAHRSSNAGSRPVYGLYGCNFAVRSSMLPPRPFDERLPLYSWLEDEDLSRRLAREGRLLQVAACACVHLGAPSGGRTSHLRFGYSQIVNPVHLFRKRTITLHRLGYLVAIPVLGNLRGLLSAGRRARLTRIRGNLLALGDLLSRRAAPERILDL